jgi:hypothetical protein
MTIQAPSACATQAVRRSDAADRSRTDPYWQCLNISGRTTWRG